MCEQQADIGGCRVSLHPQLVDLLVVRGGKQSSRDSLGAENNDVPGLKWGGLWIHHAILVHDENIRCHFLVNSEHVRLAVLTAVTKDEMRLSVHTARSCRGNDQQLTTFNTFKIEYPQG